MANTKYSESELKKRAQRRRMLVLRLEGLKEEAKLWDKYISTTERKRKVTKIIKTTAEIAELAAGVPAVGKMVGKKVGEQFVKEAAKRAIKITPESKFAQRVGASKLKETSEALGDRVPGLGVGRLYKGKPIHIEKTVVKGSKPTTARTASNRPTLSNRTRVGSNGGAAPKPLTKKEEYDKLVAFNKSRAEKAKKKEKFLEGSGAPKTSARKNK